MLAVAWAHFDSSSSPACFARSLLAIGIRAVPCAAQRRRGAPCAPAPAARCAPLPSLRPGIRPDAFVFRDAASAAATRCAPACRYSPHRIGRTAPTVNQGGNMGGSISKSSDAVSTASIPATQSHADTDTASKASSHSAQRRPSSGAFEGLMPLAQKGTVGELQNFAAAAFAATTGASPALVDAAHHNPAMQALREQPMTQENVTQLCQMETDAARKGDPANWQNRLAASSVADVARHAVAQTVALNVSLGRDGPIKTQEEGGWNVHEHVIGVHGS
ncbi:hypothetical protein BMAPRL20_0604 [Burkholderia mallei PRL-20]|uniref:Uncharacterized protein n=1 Tax=Burkholderia mallei (strain NCTC 10229) TaxID=412022 RepID=A2RY49_BURM9|nr:hypothetical protein BMA10229_0803 [Burkholderia mallei NCTC 10229]ABO03192.1 hypothetical protein BMA10247_A1767 [Burkholderia mallei NCTC 10247]EDK52073.1 hypothetical protein BMAFMH_I0126 [Burkholderia mallei FMH]EDK57378.1 hypothetical protein BMAJHU_F0120 [Burkholderia mallei JHU]EDK82791.1 hypothetical protein BMA721280_K0132 [Burkholderia mallei 2002721280]EDP85173.1 hypothetical protein BMA10399_G0636 [Burkholderia mallei ATCC 10399]EEP88554.1 conserved hypothetical protein [Burkho